MIDSVSIFDGHIPYYKITKPVRLIELFAGIGSQHQALKNLGVKIDRSTIVEWQVNSIQAYNDIHIRKYDDWTQGITKEELAYRLNQLGVSIDYNEPVKLESLMRKGEDWLRNVYNNIINTNNKVNIMSVKGSHLNITETDKYDYILTYSFPCQDLSKAGKGKGMSDKTTRSGLLWEVERILSELKELPQVLLMENVPDVIGSRFISDFQRWEERLRELGYSNHIEVLNAKNYGIPQNRERAFMVSILGDYQYRFPQKQPLTLRLKDMLETTVDERYYLSDEKIQSISQWKAQQDPLENMEHIAKTGISPTLTARGAGEEHSGMVLIKEDTSVVVVGNYSPSNHNATNIVSPNGISPIVMENHGSVTAVVVANIRKNGTSQSGNVYNKEQLSPTLCATDYKNPPKVIDTKEYANYITWLDDKGRINTQDHRAYFEDRLSGTIPAMERGVPNVLKNNLRIRKLTPRECYRLMGFGDQAFDLAQPNQSNSSLYHQAGDSIVVNVLMELFRSLL